MRSTASSSSMLGLRTPLDDVVRALDDFEHDCSSLSSSFRELRPALQSVISVVESESRRPTPRGVRPITSTASSLSDVACAGSQHPDRRLHTPRVQSTASGPGRGLPSNPRTNPANDEIPLDPSLKDRAIWMPPELVLKVLREKFERADEHELGLIRKAFWKLEDRNGSLGKFKFRLFLSKLALYPTEEGLDEVFSVLEDGSGRLGFKDLVAHFTEIAGRTLGSAEFFTVMDVGCRFKRPPRTPPRDPAELDAVDAEDALKSKMSDRLVEFAKAFRSVGRDEQGRVGRAQFKELLARYCIYMDEVEFEKLFQKVDLDSNGTVDFMEFMARFGSHLYGKDEGHSASIIRGPGREQKLGRKALKINPRLMDLQVIQNHLAEKMRENFPSMRKAFWAFARKSGTMGEPQFEKFLAASSLYPSKADLSILFKQISSTESMSLEDLKSHFSQSLGMNVERNVQYSTFLDSCSKYVLPVTPREESSGMTAFAVEQVLSKKMEEALSEVCRVFRACDVNKQGSLSRTEFRKFLGRFGITIDGIEFERLLRKVDPCRTGSAEYISFVKCFGNGRKINEHGCPRDENWRNSVARLTQHLSVQEPGPPARGKPSPRPPTMLGRLTSALDFAKPSAPTPLMARPPECGNRPNSARDLAKMTRPGRKLKMPGTARRA